ncbi:MAG: thiamine-phosphate pyrophosphorylase [bacterium]|jgi:thiamine-phosphate pyrophosphorylase
MLDTQSLRIIDANSNRTREALRVVEDVVRFSWEDARTASRLKRERHLISRACDVLLRKNFKGLKARDTFRDPGRDSMSKTEGTRKNLDEILLSNFRRAEEGLRVLEEVSKLAGPGSGRPFKRARFRVYNLEKACLLKLGRRARSGRGKSKRSGSSGPKRNSGLKRKSGRGRAGA